MEMEQYFDMNVINSLKNIGGGDNSFLLEIFELYMKQAPDLLQEIKVNASNNDADKMSKTAHTLKGASLNIGASKFAEICSKIEIAGKENNMINISGLIKDMEYNFSKVKEIIDNYK